MTDEAALTRRKIEAQERVVRARTKLDQTKAALASITAREATAARKKRTRGLIEAGGLLVVAGLVDGDTGALLVEPDLLVGALIRLSGLANKGQDPALAPLRVSGAAALQARAKMRHRSAPEVQATKKPSSLP